MAYLMVKYQQPTTYALIDLSIREVVLIEHGLRELQEFYERLGAGSEQVCPTEALIRALERRYDDEDEDGPDSAQ